MTDKRCRHHPDCEPVLVLTPDITHYGKWVCNTCSKFIVWARNPGTNRQVEKRQILIRAILRENRLDILQDDTLLSRLLGLYNKPHLNLMEDKFLENL